VAEINSEPLNSRYNEVMSQVAGQCADYIDSTAAAAARRRLMQAGTAEITSTVSSDTPEVRAPHVLQQAAASCARPAGLQPPPAQRARVVPLFFLAEQLWRQRDAGCLGETHIPQRTQTPTT
jgi:hypothetical protein